MLQTTDLSIARGPVAVLHGITASFAAGSISVLAGPNGAGKSTLLEALAGDLAPAAGQLLLHGKPLAGFSLHHLAQHRAMLPQRATIAFDFPVSAVVAIGLHPHGLTAQSPGGAALVQAALEAMDLAPFADRPASRLSGGEQQRVHLARCLVQVRAALAAGKSPLLLLDEPTTGLDYRHQYALAAALRELAGCGVAVIASLHDLAFAATLADTVLLLDEGRCIAQGRPADVLTAARIAALYRLDRQTAARLVSPPPGRPAAPAGVPAVAAA
jgi:iron complex transport system ATP-binding protein